MEKKATKATSISAIRKVLGVKAFDDNTRLTLLVEGKEDERSLKAILPQLSKKISNALNVGTLTLTSLTGAPKLTYHLSLLQSQISLCHVLLDDDREGRLSGKKCTDNNTLKVADLTLTKCRGMIESEFEDCLDKEIYREKFLSEFGVDVLSSKFKGKKKWSNRLKELFSSEGRIWNDNIKNKAKKYCGRLYRGKP